MSIFNWFIKQINNYPIRGISVLQNWKSFPETDLKSDSVTISLYSWGFCLTLLERDRCLYSIYPKFHPIAIYHFFVQLGWHLWSPVELFNCTVGLEMLMCLITISLYIWIRSDKVQNPICLYSWVNSIFLASNHLFIQLCKNR